MSYLKQAVHLLLLLSGWLAVYFFPGQPLAAQSDPKAEALAISVMDAMGGLESWEAVRYVRWTFAGARTLTWDKHGQRVRIDFPGKDRIYLLDLATDTGRVQQTGVVLTHPDTIAKYVTEGQYIFINDSYWLAMPFKMLDPGVTLKHLGETRTLQGNEPALSIEMTFDQVGFTPQNKYIVRIDPESKLIKEWSYYRDATDPEPSLTTHWKDYQTYGKVKLSGDRGRVQLTDIAVMDEVSKDFFNPF